MTQPQAHQAPYPAKPSNARLLAEADRADRAEQPQAEPSVTDYLQDTEHVSPD